MIYPMRIFIMRSGNLYRKINRIVQLLWLTCGIV